MSSLRNALFYCIDNQTLIKQSFRRHFDAVEQATVSRKHSTEHPGHIIYQLLSYIDLFKYHIPDGHWHGG